MERNPEFRPRRPLTPDRIAALEAAGVKVHAPTLGPKPVEIRGLEITSAYIDDPETLPPSPQPRPMGLLDYLELLGERIDRALPMATMLMVIAFLLLIAVIVLSGLAADLAERAR